jgi:NADPH:quinone reductase
MARAIQVSNTGRADVLKLTDIKVGAPGHGEVRVIQRASGVNYIDVFHRSGLYPLPLPFVPGMEGAGVIEEIGSGVKDFEIGDRVAYAGVLGSYCDVRLVPANRLVRLPDEISDELAAAVLFKGLTAQMLLRQVYSVAPGDVILIHAAAGGLGLIMCQWAKSLGATVIGTVSSDEKAKIASAHGCDHPIVYSREDFVKRVIEITDGRKLPVVFDSIGKDTFSGSLDCLQPRGLMVVSGTVSGTPPAIEIATLAQRGALFLTRPVLFAYIETQLRLKNAAEELFTIVASGKIVNAIRQRYSLAEANKAHLNLETRSTVGASILTM